MSPKADPGGDLSGYCVLVAVCGGIAAYKVCHVVSALVQRGARVNVAMTEAGTRFVGEATFAALSGRPVLTSLWDPRAAADPQHIRLTESADLTLVAPATYNMIGKIATGLADDLVSTLLSATAGPVMLVPAMNSRMWEHPALQANIARLGDLGYLVVGPAEGWLACRTVGPGRMVEPDQILDAAAAQLRSSPPKAGPAR